MQLSEYQRLTREFAVYPEEKALEYLGLGLSSEAGEVTGKIKKLLRGDHENDVTFKESLTAEIGDCFWYLARLCDTLGVDAEMVIGNNIDKLTERKNKGMIKGDGDDRGKVNNHHSHSGNRATINDDYLERINNNYSLGEK